MAKETKVNTLPTRKDLEVEDTWRLEDIFATDNDWESAYKEVKEEVTKAGQFQGKLGESADMLYRALQFQDEVLEKLGKVYAYSHMRYDQDTTNSLYQGFDDRAKNLYAQAASPFAYIVPELLSVDEKKIAQFVSRK